LDSVIPQRYFSDDAIAGLWQGSLQGIFMTGWGCREGLHSLVSGAASPSESSGASLRAGINCLGVDPSFAGWVMPYVARLFERFVSAGNGCRFCLFSTERNQHIFDRIQNHVKFEVVVIHGTAALANRG
jgi:hypothetical protein